MRCIKCGCDESRVIDSRTSDNGAAIRRRRECVACGYRFTTYERREEMPLIVIKRDGSQETFDREKLMRGLIRATIKRDVSLDDLIQFIDEIETELRDGHMNEITSEYLGELVLMRLKDLDKVAYIRFASVYRNFESVEEFISEVQRMD